MPPHDTLFFSKMTGFAFTLIVYRYAAILGVAMCWQILSGDFFVT
jgi:hypothetical protein